MTVITDPIAAVDAVIGVVSKYASLPTLTRLELELADCETDIRHAECNLEELKEIRDAKEEELEAARRRTGLSDQELVELNLAVEKRG